MLLLQEKCEELFLFNLFHIINVDDYTIQQPFLTTTILGKSGTKLWQKMWYKYYSMSGSSRFLKLVEKTA